MLRIILFCFPVAVSLIFGGCQPPILNEINRNGIYSTVAGEKCTLRKNGNFITLSSGSQRINFNGSWVYLLEPLLSSGGKSVLYSLSQSNLNKIIYPLLNREIAPAGPVKVIVIDPGHGGSDVGAVGTKYQEKTLNLALARMIAAELSRRGFVVKMTRDTDKYISLAARGRFAAAQKADLFISVHHNAAANKTATGVETYAMTPYGFCNTDGGNVAKSVSPSNRYDSANLNLAQEIQLNLVRATAGPDRGVKFARFQVLTQAQCPAVLIEAGFITTPKEEILIANSQRQRNVAVAVANAVAAFNRYVVAAQK